MISPSRETAVGGGGGDPHVAKEAVGHRSNRIKIPAGAGVLTHSSNRNRLTASHSVRQLLAETHSESCRKCEEEEFVPVGSGFRSFVIRREKGEKQKRDRFLCETLWNFPIVRESRGFFVSDGARILRGESPVKIRFRGSGKARDLSSDAFFPALITPVKSPHDA